ncbi:Glycosyltransferase involved in cell wall bisynthesis (RfaB) (PDB:2IV7) [Commensalibacter communis]|uniref:glycosyltransferase family 4 protein n=1 Tax=Commensalibacter communis TaxID=2972786 RepID=UPI0022FF9B8B|nr:glycosyltransferase family 4 protein [Commensalibacter communis]CAI3933960.1 Glycosyltransferase involved in cell wall bisynthesis (RfaB) (PDB:2IV7) [Commensalibacter communis]
MKKPLNMLIWQWGRRGAGPKTAVEFSKAVVSIPNVKAFLSLSCQAEILQKDHNVSADFQIQTYTSVLGYLYRVLQAPLMIYKLHQFIRHNKIDVAICTMPGPMDLVMAAALKLHKIPYIVVVHDVHPHPGDGYIFQHFLQKLLIKRSRLTVTFSKYVYKQLIAVNYVRSSQIIQGWHPPFSYWSKNQQLQSVNQEIQLLNFGRLLLYKGFDLLEEALDQISIQQPYKLRIVGQGPKSAVLDRLNKRQNVIVENRWVPEEEIGELMQWADVVILPYREASQSGIAATALAFGKPILITNVGGLSEQFGEDDLAFICEPTVADIAKGLDEILQLNFPLSHRKHDADKEWQDLAEYLIKEITNKLHLS